MSEMTKPDSRVIDFFKNTSYNKSSSPWDK